MDVQRFDRRVTESAPGQAEWFDLVHESLVVRDLEGRALVWNAAAERLYGLPREQVLGQWLEPLLRSSPVEVREAGERRLLETGRWDGELRRHHADGGELHVELCWALHRDAEGRPSHVVETGRDLSERRRAELALRDSEHRYRNLFGAMAASFWELDFSGVGALLRGLRKAGVENYAQYFTRHPEFCRQMIGATRIVDINDETVRLFGRGDKAELMADLNAYWPDESLAVYAASTLAAVGGLPHYRIETRLRRLDGSVFDALFTACFAPEAVARGRLLIGVIDISERKRTFAALERSESRYRNLFQAMAVSFWQLDSSRLNALFAGLRAQGVSDLRAYIDEHPEFLQKAMEASVAIEVNERALKLFGASEVQQLLGPVTRFWIPGRAEAFRGSIEAGWRREPGYQAETRLRTVDGREIQFIRGTIREVEGTIYMVSVPLIEPMYRRVALQQTGYPAFSGGVIRLSNEFRINNSWDHRRIRMKRVARDAEMVSEVEAWRWIPRDRQ